MQRWPLLTLFVPALLAAQPPAPRPEPEITTTGVAEVRLPADRAIVYFGVMTTATTAADAAARNGEATRRVQAAVRAMGYREQDVRATGFSVGPQYDPREGQRIVGYQARTQVEVTMRDFDRIGRLMDTALGAGANNVGGQQFLSDTAERARLGVIKRAYDNARAEAAALAAAAGGRLGAVRSMTTTQSSGLAGGVESMRMAGAGMADLGAPDVSREVVVSAWVQVRWIFEPQ